MKYIKNARFNHRPLSEAVVSNWNKIHSEFMEASLDPRNKAKSLSVRDFNIYFEAMNGKISVNLLDDGEFRIDSHFISAELDVRDIDHVSLLGNYYTFFMKNGKKLNFLVD